MEENENLARKRHSLAHLLAAAVLELYPDAKNTIGPAIDNGFYYDFDNLEISDADLLKIEKKMQEIVKHWETFSEIEVSVNEAKKIFADNQYKLELIDEIVDKKEGVTLYYSGPKSSIPSLSDLKTSRSQLVANSFLDLCRGGHVENPTKDIAAGSWKLSRIAGAYWRGDEKNKMLTRIYGLAFASKKALADYEKRMVEAEKRDHKKLGRELDLFTFSDLIGAGLPLWTPKGTLLRDLLEGFVWELRVRRGYQRVDIPHITKKELYEKSGHWDKFKDELFKIKTREGHEFVMKPMNCPHHTQIYARKLWSYRELPQRYANTTKVYRDEQTGELAGLLRVRAITQDDAHVFCRQEQVKKEIVAIWDIITEFYGAFGFKLSIRLSLHDHTNMKVYLGDEATWQKSENELRAIVKEKGVKAEEALGEAAFYGPKIDFMGEDSLGRQWQVATIQLDMNMPERFDLVCVNEKNERERIVMIHAAIMGSIERFFSILIEHFAGAFPLWLSPVQVKILPVSEKQISAAREALAALLAVGIRAELDESNETLGKKVRAVKIQKIPYWLVIGDKEISANKVTLESRVQGNLGQISIAELISKFQKEISERK
ncbi:MAG: threonine--tRNA ligase [Candidatus Taylorbacteria bacterium RIFCSPHIGHO2_02_FULL_44_36]|uniref:Threonine--tRNA ligase n=1 Tax=Candidatus Taylorbacteria bacterium RIFCSPLOWO2_12_FULL_44_15c TaxID=1802333 RepID=A0A1G2P6A2_9BACT|nr:MAG: threonine--tRNA ligase [Candidatus Taylorbacteria bacterium RIFCSPHIGHO2_02_FULL_44_36]OHA38584.1 MAG: threonine--tRNA ligase [Candidatus Taylorbacteria bacterium RIFCSPLOWO2_02_FULL_44_35]OHA43868.1 MAG: threonine--tRNA ligase [Candidatus Taylorbacteria bacterium RIFCSPLOWO2_12_FULL_44_15c]